MSSLAFSEINFQEVREDQESTVHIEDHEVLIDHPRDVSLGHSVLMYPLRCLRKSPWRMVVLTLEKFESSVSTTPECRFVFDCIDVFVLLRFLGLVDCGMDGVNV